MRTSQIPLSALVHTQRDLAPLVVTHTQSFPSTTVSFTVSFNVLDDVPLAIAAPAE